MQMTAYLLHSSPEYAPIIYRIDILICVPKASDALAMIVVSSSMGAVHFRETLSHEYI